MSGTLPQEIPVILHHTRTDTNTPALLYAGETAWAVGPTRTKLWIGDGTNNRLLLSTNLTDNPLLRQQPTVSDMRPTNPVPNDLWWDSETGAFFIRFKAQWVQIGGPPVEIVP